MRLRLKWHTLERRREVIASRSAEKSKIRDLKSKVARLAQCISYSGSTILDDGILQKGRQARLSPACQRFGCEKPFLVRCLTACFCRESSPTWSAERTRCHHKLNLKVIARITFSVLRGVVFLHAEYAAAERGPDNRRVLVLLLSHVNYSLNKVVAREV
jgi:hypothetical protein